MHSPIGALSRSSFCLHWCGFNLALLSIGNVFLVQDYTRWADTVNYTTITNKWFARQMYFPFNLIYCNRRREDVLARVKIMYQGDHINAADVEKDVSFVIDKRTVSHNVTCRLFVVVKHVSIC